MRLRPLLALLLLSACDPPKEPTDGDGVPDDSGQEDAGDTGDADTGDGAADTGDSGAADTGGDTAADAGGDTAADTADTGAPEDTEDTGPTCAPDGSPGTAPAGEVDLLRDVAQNRIDGTVERGYFGREVAVVADADGDGYPELLVGSTSQGAVFRFPAPVRGVGDQGDATLTLTGDTDAWTAYAVADAGDVDGDGVPDLLVGAPRDANGGEEAGAVFVVSGALTGTHDLATAAMATLRGTAGEEVGTALASAGDVDGDGLADVLVGAPGAVGETGAVYVVSGASLSGTVRLSDVADAAWLGERGGDRAGDALAAGSDADGDGVADAIVGAPGNSSGGEDAGRAYVVSLAAPSGDLADAPTLTGDNHDASSDGFGSAVAFAGDVDGDGAADVLVSAPYWELDELPCACDYDCGYDANACAYEMYACTACFDDGAAFLFRGPIAGDLGVGDADAVWDGTWGEGIGDTIAGLGDVNGDGFDDLGVHGPGGMDKGDVYVLYGSAAPASGAVDTLAGAVLTGGTGYAYAGTALAGGDLNCDGYADFVVGARGEDGNASMTPYGGTVWVVYGGP